MRSENVSLQQKPFSNAQKEMNDICRGLRERTARFKNMTPEERRIKFLEEQKEILAEPEVQYCPTCHGMKYILDEYNHASDCPECSKAPVKSKTDIRKKECLDTIPVKYRKHLTADYSDCISKEQSISIRSWFENIKIIAREEGEYPEKTSLFFYGRFGAYKTSMSCVALYKAIEYGFTGRFLNCLDIIHRAQRSIRENSDDDPVELGREAGILLLDDFGAKRKVTDFNIDLFLDMISERYDWGKPTIYTSNCTLVELQGIFGERIMRRIIESSFMIEI